MTPDLLDAAPLLLAAFVPLAFLAGAALVSGRAPFRAARVASGLAAALALAAVALRLAGPSSPPAPGALQAWLELDVATSAMLLLVTALGVVVVRYSKTYLAREAGLPRYERGLLLVLASVSVLVPSKHLGVVAVAWFGTSAALHQLLTFYPARAQALVAAHKKFLLSRLADACFVAALATLEAGTGTLRIDELARFAQAEGALTPALQAAAALLAFGVLLKSAQLPFHGWMTQVMEAPTPVSALLHAGVVNLGGFVMIRLAGFMVHAPVAQGLLLTGGLVTALVASLVMMTRVSVKVALAWSTIAQMGFMLLECGLGAWHLALLHLLAHSAYKANAFLSAGEAVSAWRSGALVAAPRLTARWIRSGTAAALAVISLGLAALDALRPGSVTTPVAALGFLLALSTGPALGRGLAAGWRTGTRSALRLAAAALAWGAWHALFDRLLPPPVGGAATALAWSIVAAGFLALFVVQTVLQTRPTSRFAAWLQPRLFGAFFLDEWFTRMTFRLWPPRLEPRPRAASIAPVTTSQEIPSC